MSLNCNHAGAAWVTTSHHPMWCPGAGCGPSWVPPPSPPRPPTPLRPPHPRWAHAPHGRGAPSHCGLRCCWTTSRSLALVEMPFVRRPCECEACPGRGQRRSGAPGQVAPGGAALHLPFKIKTLSASLNHTQCHIHSIRVNREGVRARYAHQTNVRMHMYI